jgi:hypothetical protein
VSRDVSHMNEMHNECRHVLRRRSLKSYAETIWYVHCAQFSKPGLPRKHLYAYSNTLARLYGKNDRLSKIKSLFYMNAPVRPLLPANCNYTILLIHSSWLMILIWSVSTFINTFLRQRRRRRYTGLSFETRVN